MLSAVSKEEDENEFGNLPMARVADVESDATSCQLGLTGRLDASITLITGAEIPLEVKTGSGAVFNAEHHAQTVLYAMLLQEAQGLLDEGQGHGYLVYLQGGVNVKKVSFGLKDMRRLLLIRNKIAEARQLSRRRRLDDILPPCWESEGCLRCDVAFECALFHGSRRLGECASNNSVEKHAKNLTEHLGAGEERFMKIWQPIVLGRASRDERIEGMRALCYLMESGDHSFDLRAYVVFNLEAAAITSGDPKKRADQVLQRMMFGTTVLSKHRASIAVVASRGDEIGLVRQLCESMNGLGMKMLLVCPDLFSGREWFVTLAVNLCSKTVLDGTELLPERAAAAKDARKRNGESGKKNVTIGLAQTSSARKRRCESYDLVVIIENEPTILTQCIIPMMLGTNSIVVTQRSDFGGLSHCLGVHAEPCE